MTIKVRRDFQAYAPDLDDYGNQGLGIANNVLHQPEGYKEVRQYSTGSAITGIGGVPRAFTGTPSNLVEWSPVGDNSAWVGVAYSPADNTFQVGFGGEWAAYIGTGTAGLTGGAIGAFSAAELGDTVVATARYNFKTTASGAAANTATAVGYLTYDEYYGSGAWTALPNSATGLVCGRINQFVFVGNEGTVNPIERATVRWCAIGDATDWPIPATDDARSKQAGEQALDPKYGDVTGIAGNDFFGYIFQESAITKVTYVGGDVVFTFDTFEEARGCGYIQRLVAVDDMVFYESRSNRYAVIDGQVTNIGYGLVDDTYPPVSDFYSLKKNPAIQTVFFSNNLAYNYVTQQWTRVPDIEPKISIDSATGIIGQHDSEFGNGYDSTGGTPLTATFETGSADLNPGGRAVVTGVRPFVNGGTVTVRVGRQENLDDSVTYSASTSINHRSGMADLRIEGRYQRVELTIAGGFTTAQGIEIEYSPQGYV